MRAKETRCGPVAVIEALREAAKSGPSEGSRRNLVTRTPDDPRPRPARTGPKRAEAGVLSHADSQRAAQRGSVADRYTARNSSAAVCITLPWSIAPQRLSVKSGLGLFGPRSEEHTSEIQSREK